MTFGDFVKVYEQVHEAGGTDAPSLRDRIADDAAARALFLRPRRDSARLATSTRHQLRRPPRQLAGRSVLLPPRPLTAALALIELDGIARRLVLCPPDLAAAHLPPRSPPPRSTRS